MEQLVEYNGRQITKTEFDKIQEEIRKSNDIKVVKMNENTYKTRLHG